MASDGQYGGGGELMMKSQAVGDSERKYCIAEAQQPLGMINSNYLKETGL